MEILIWRITLKETEKYTAVIVKGDTGTILSVKFKNPESLAEFAVVIIGMQMTFL